MTASVLPSHRDVTGNVHCQLLMYVVAMVDYSGKRQSPTWKAKLSWHESYIVGMITKVLTITMTLGLQVIVAVAVDVADWVWVGTPRVEDSLQDFKYIRKFLDLEESSTHEENKQRTTKTMCNDRI
jgi:hypothetical protein